MKSFLICTGLLCALGFGCYAQTEKGNSMVGGSFSYSSDKLQANGKRTNNFYVVPRYGYFLNHDLAVGLELPINLSRLNFKSYQSYNRETGFYEESYAPKEFSIGFSPFLRKYFLDKNRFSFFVQTNALLLLNTYNDIEDGYLRRTEVKARGFGAKLSAGLAFNITDDTQIEFCLPLANFFHQSYFNERSEYNYDKKNNFNVFPNVVSPSIGVQAHF